MTLCATWRYTAGSEILTIPRQITVVSGASEDLLLPRLFTEVQSTATICRGIRRFSRKQRIPRLYAGVLGVFLARPQTATISRGTGLLVACNEYHGYMWGYSAFSRWRLRPRLFLAVLGFLVAATSSELLLGICRIMSLKLLFFNIKPDPEVKI